MLVAHKNTQWYSHAKAEKIKKDDTENAADEDIDHGGVFNLNY